MATGTIQKRERNGAQAELTRDQRTFVPQIDIVERKDELLLIADVPGAKPDEVDIDYEAGTLTVHARVERSMPDAAQYLLREYGVGDFHRRFEVGEGIDADKISANLEDGVLTIHLPKAEALKPRKIAVSAAT